MKQEQCYENYPFWIVLISILVSIAIYVIGAFIIYNLGTVWLVLYIILILIQEFRIIKGHCTDCYYYGKTCSFGRGRLAVFFKKGNAKNFCRMKITWKDMIPYFLISLVPAVIGIILLIKDFSLIILFAVIILIILTFLGNAFVRGNLACKYCKQRQIGCSAQKLFEKKTLKNS